MNKGTHRRFVKGMAVILASVSVLVICKINWRGLSSVDGFRQGGSGVRSERGHVVEYLSYEEKVKFRDKGISSSKIDREKLILILKENDNSAGLQQCGRFLKEELARTGSYSSVNSFLRMLPNDDALALIGEWLIGTSTSAGTLRDYEEQKVLVDSFNISGKIQLIDRVHYEAGGRAFPDLAIGFARDGHEQESRVLELMVKGSAGHHGVFDTVKAMSLMFSGGDRIKSFGGSIEFLLNVNSTEASEAIAALPQGQSKDVMIEYLIDWLDKKGEAQLIDAWIEVVGDPGCRGRLSDKYGK